MAKYNTESEPKMTPNAEKQKQTLIKPSDMVRVKPVYIYWNHMSFGQYLKE